MENGFNIFIKANKNAQGVIDSIVVFDTGAEKTNVYSARTVAQAISNGQLKIYGFTDYAKKAGQPFTFKNVVPISANEQFVAAVSYPDIYIALKSYIDDNVAKNKPIPQAIVEYQKVLENGNAQFHEYLKQRGYI